MAKIEWNESLKLNIPVIDVQHRRWVDIINELHDSLMSRGGGHTLTDQTLNKMIDYGKFHFAFEEKFMKEIGYPDIKKHKSMHDAFMKNIVNKLQAERTGGLVLNTELMKILVGWLQSHITVEDSKYKEYAT